MKKNYEEVIIKYLRSLIARTLLAIIIFLMLAIFAKTSRVYKDLIVTNIYEKNLSFTKIKKLYTKYLGGITPLDNVIEKEITVFNESLTYDNQEKYYDGVKLSVDKNYLVPSQIEGMVIYIGKKDNYGNTIIIEGTNDIDIWYGNIDKTAVKLYDYVEKGTYLGTTIDNNLYLAYVKNGEFLNYQEYLK